jgi:cell division protein FtsB
MKNPPWANPTLSRNTILALLLVCIALVVHEVFGEHGYLALRHQQKEVESLQQDIQRLRQENEQLDRQIKALKSDPKAIERLAREQMRMARPGEIIYTFPEKERSQAPPSKDSVPK